jgi:FAD/FMN-containing dehydrogenase
VIDALRTVFPPERVRIDADTLSQWGGDRTASYEVAPAAVVFPTSTHDVVALVRLANEHGFALVPSGGRTGLSGGAVASRGEVVVSFDHMNAILDFNPTDRLVRCQAGVITQVLQEFAAERGLCYPVDFASAGSSQIGGNIATNAGGIKVIRYGLTRDWVAGLTAVTGTGEVVECNQGLVKNATGYDLRHLLIGSEGTLALIVEAEMRLAAAPLAQSVMVLGVARFADLLAVLERFQSRVTLSAFEFFSELALTKVLAHRSLRRPFPDPAPFYALLEFDEPTLDEAMAAFESCVAEGWVGDGVVSQSTAQARDLWRLREDISESIAPFLPYKNDVSVKVSQVPGFLDDVEGVVRAAYPDLEVCWYGHIGDGNLHLNILKPEGLDGAEFYSRCHAISPQIFEVVERYDGSISAEHGVGLLKRDFLAYSRSSGEIELMHRLKAVFDPKGVLNPGKLLPTLAAPDM